ncbi:hypothetical protein IT6_03755 [Methylacidiphilum caldifontis]|uniref:hypothetical protein n=1 Tax=Methylacidiphilum caldifontis TaxID=2795386 RepID=UPI001A8F57D5|nr:hypothetical protein [Methylacidiphilum caldifontis]QSR89405.1 hypothetical protein IT6_03755 [Methylacidiphilum caldifontis]
MGPGGILPAKRTPANWWNYAHEDYVREIGQKASRRQFFAYARVSSAGQKGNLKKQWEALERFCLAQGKPISFNSV